MDIDAIERRARVAPISTRAAATSVCYASPLTSLTYYDSFRRRRITLRSKSQLQRSSTGRQLIVLLRHRGVGTASRLPTSASVLSHR